MAKKIEVEEVDINVEAGLDDFAPPMGVKRPMNGWVPSDDPQEGRHISRGGVRSDHDDDCDCGYCAG